MRFVAFIVCLFFGQLAFGGEHEPVTFSSSVSNSVASATNSFPYSGILKGMLIKVSGTDVSVSNTLKAVRGSMSRDLYVTNVSADTTLQIDLSEPVYEERFVWTAGNGACATGATVNASILIER